MSSLHSLFRQNPAIAVFPIVARKNTPIEEPEPDQEPAPVEEPGDPGDPGPAEDPEEQPVEG